MRKTKKAAPSTPAPRWILNEKTAPPVIALGAMVGVILLTLLFHSVIKPKSATVPVSKTSATALTLTGADGVKIGADFDVPPGDGPHPVVILVHEFGQDRSQWDSYRDFFIGEGFGVLRYDIRGFGDSVLSSVPSAQGAWFASMPNDLSAAIRFIKEQQRFFANKIFVIGVGLGANIAYVGAGTIDGINKTVVLSPTINAQLDGSNTDNFFPKNILAVINESEREIAESLLSRVTGEKNITAVTEPGVRGFDLLQQDDIQQKISNWLTQ